MTQNEVDIIKNAVLDSTEAYVDARLSVLDFVKTQIGVVISNEKKNGKYYHKVRCNATRQTPEGITYNNVLSVGNTPFPPNCVVFMVAPNAQFSNQFILGQLDDTPVNIVGGSIRLGGTDETNAPIYLTSTPIRDSSGNYYYGHIGSFYIYNNEFRVGDAILSRNIIGCGEAGLGIVNIVGGNDNAYIQISDSGTPTNCLDGVRIFQDGKVSKYHSSGGDHPTEVWDWDLYLSNIPPAGFGEMLTQYIETNPSTGDLRWKS